MLRQIIQEEIPDLRDFSASISDLPIDSFGMVVLRARIETALGHPVSDQIGGEVETPNDILALSSAQEIVVPSRSGAQERRRFSINMPQMAIEGLSESWLLKELGDMHWGMITAGLGSPSSSLKDGGGNRLYATFTRICYVLQRPFSAIAENSTLDCAGRSPGLAPAPLFRTSPWIMIWPPVKRG
jgi:hypothetical protein